MMNSDINDPTNRFSTLASYMILEGDYNSKDLSSISFNLVRVPYNIKKEIDDLEASDVSNKDVIIKSLQGAIPSIYNFRSEKDE